MHEYAGFDLEYRTADVTGTGHPGRVAWVQMAFLNAHLREVGAEPDTYCTKDCGTVFLVKGLHVLKDLPTPLLDAMRACELVGVGIKGDVTKLRSSFPSVKANTLTVTELSSKDFHGDSR
jgi:hypothetical protein